MAERRHFRIAYYNLFSRFYDRFIDLHSGDREGDLRDELASMVGVQPGGSVLDLCTGTGSMLAPLAKQVEESGKVTGVDFSPGMLDQARNKVADLRNMELVEADVTDLPFPDNHFDGAVCSHAFYELKGDAPLRFLHEVHRVLKPGRRFLMMEHEVPENLIVRILFYFRVFSMGSAKTLRILRHEREIFLQVFKQVEKRIASSGRSKIYICTKQGEEQG